MPTVDPTKRKCSIEATTFFGNRQFQFAAKALMSHGWHKAIRLEEGIGLDGAFGQVAPSRLIVGREVVDREKASLQCGRAPPLDIARANQTLPGH